RHLKKSLDREEGPFFSRESVFAYPGDGLYFPSRTVNIGDVTLLNIPLPMVGPTIVSTPYQHRILASRKVHVIAVNAAGSVGNPTFQNLSITVRKESQDIKAAVCIPSSPSSMY